MFYEYELNGKLICNLLLDSGLLAGAVAWTLWTDVLPLLSACPTPMRGYNHPDSSTPSRLFGNNDGNGTGVVAYVVVHNSL